jgi:hypothetical protein
MANSTFTGNRTIAAADYKYVKWVGKTKGGKSVTIEIDPAINMGNIEWAFAEKNDTVADITFTGCYNDTDLAAGTTTEPWVVTTEDGISAGSPEIVLGTGVFYIGATAGTATAVGLTRGGGAFKVEREYREINADGDPGPVEGRIQMERSVCTLNMKNLQFIVRMADIYNGITAVTGTAITFVIENLTVTGDTYSVLGRGVRVVFEAWTGYQLPTINNITVESDATEIVGGEYLYDADTGILEIPGARVTGAITITATGQA